MKEYKRFTVEKSSLSVGLVDLLDVISLDYCMLCYVQCDMKFTGGQKIHPELNEISIIVKASCGKIKRKKARLLYLYILLQQCHLVAVSRSSLTSGVIPHRLFMA